jgi:preprotein translocase subunit Sec61beta
MLNPMWWGTSWRHTLMPKATKKRKKGETGPMPSGGAGLIRFFEDETPGIKIGPTMVVIIAAALVIITVVAHIWTEDLANVSS